MAKTYAGTYLYSKYDEYEREIFTFLMSGTVLDKDGADFEDIKYDVKRRQVSNALVKVLESNDVVLVSNSKPLSKAFKVFCAKDIKNGNKNKMKVYIDVSNIITQDQATGKWVCRGNNIDIFISYLVSAMHTYIYYADETRITNNSKIVSVGAEAFAILLTSIVDYLCKISSMPQSKNKCMYMASLYYLANLLGKDYTTDGSKHIAKKISGLSDREAGLIDIQIEKDCMTNIKFFIENLADVLHINKITLDLVVERWMTVYGTGTVFALEMFPAFASMLSDAYVGAYVNNQRAIEKYAGTKMTEFAKTILQIGAESV